MKILQKNEYIYWFLDIILCFPFFGAQYFADNPITKEFFAYSRLLIAFFFFLFYLKNRIGIGIPISILLMAVCLSIETLENRDDIFLAVSRYYSIFGIVFLIAVRKNSFKRFLYSIFCSAEILVYLNLLLMFLYPNGFLKDRYWLIGQKQDFVTVFLIAVTVSLLLWYTYKLRIRVILLFCAMILSQILVLSLGLTIALAIYVGLVVFTQVSGKRLSCNFLFSTNLLLELFMVSIGLAAGKYRSFIMAFNNIKANDTMSKSDTFMERVTMWNDALATIPNHLFGVGYLTEHNYFKYIDYIYYPHVHNMMIDICFTSGIISLIAFIYINKITYKALSGIETTQRDIFAYGIFSMNILMLTECFYWPFAFGLYMLAFVYVYNFKNKMVNVYQ